MSKTVLLRRKCRLLQPVRTWLASMKKCRPLQPVHNRAPRANRQVTQNGAWMSTRRFRLQES
eukprot:6277592-Prorocentrum_lima.AAC.1